MFSDRRLKIEKAIEDKQVKTDTRKYFGLSGIGHPCNRYLFYQFRLFLPPEIITPRQNRLFNRGHLEEPILLADLKAEGVKVVSTQKECSACSGHVKGHLDAQLENIPDAPKTPHLAEFKTSATKYFNPLVKSQSVQHSFPSHYDQCQSYMHLFKLKRTLYICVNKEDDRRYFERIKYDKKYCKNLMAKAEMIVLATRPPNRLGDSNFYRCGEKWCRYRDICHFEAWKEINRSCRSCKHSEVHTKGRWKCAKKKKYLSFKKQKRGCKQWKML